MAGRFYPADRKQLEMNLAALAPQGVHPRKEALAVIVPHAGYVYSGAIAGEVFARVEIPRRVVILSPNHTGLGVPVSVSEFDVWETPLGKAPVDTALRKGFLHACDQARLDIHAHLREHAIEVEIPFLQFARPDVFILPITLGSLDAEACLRVGEALADTLRSAAESGPFLIVSSSDMNHYESAKVGRKKDERAIARITALDPEGLFKTVHDEDISMCGVLPATVMLAAARRLGAKSAKQVRYGNSGDVNGDYDSVVGYAGIVVQ